MMEHSLQVVKNAQHNHLPFAIFLGKKQGIPFYVKMM